MKTKDQIILENLYQNILKESESLVDSGIDEQQKRKIIHDIMNNLMAFTLLDDENSKMVIDSLVSILNNLRSVKDNEIKNILNVVINRLNSI
jgi:hypothetical protein